MHRSEPDTVSVTFLKSSDDSMTLYMSAYPEGISHAIKRDRKCLKLIGINLSESKTLLCRHGYGEYILVPGWGVSGTVWCETSSIRSQGKNPSDHFYTIAKSTSVS
jgi:hypothetical protein